MKNKDESMIVISDDIICRKIRMDDITDVCNLYIKEERLSWSFEELNKYIQRTNYVYGAMLCQGSYTYGMFKKDNLIGAINVNKILNYYPGYEKLPYVQLETFIISKPYQNKGYGTMLLQSIIELLEREGCNYILIQSENEYVQKIANKCGLTKSFKNMRIDFIQNKE